jgi:hypothetical protein
MAERPLAMKKVFTTKLRSEARDVHVAIPFDVKAVFGRARPPVVVRIADLVFRSTVSVYGGRYYLPLRRDRRERLGVKGGDRVTIEVELDTAIRRVELPADLAAVLAKDAKARAEWGRLSYSRQKEYAEAIEQARKPETRARRLAKTRAALASARGLPHSSRSRPSS